MLGLLLPRSILDLESAGREGPERNEGLGQAVLAQEPSSAVAAGPWRLQLVQRTSR